MNISYKNKYLKYKNKYLELKKQLGGTKSMHSPSNVDEQIAKIESELKRIHTRLIQTNPETPRDTKKEKILSELLSKYKWVKQTQDSLDLTEEQKKVYVAQLQGEIKKLQNELDDINYESEFQKVSKSNQEALQKLPHMLR